MTKEEILELLKAVIDPELFVSIVDLGLVYGAYATGAGDVTVWMTLTSPGCPAADEIVAKCEEILLAHPEINGVEVKIIWEPKWNPKMMCTDEGKEALGIW